MSVVLGFDAWWRLSSGNRKVPESDQSAMLHFACKVFRDKGRGHVTPQKRSPASWHVF
jgi:hypothetical protein